MRAGRDGTSSGIESGDVGRCINRLMFFVDHVRLGVIFLFYRGKYEYTQPPLKLKKQKAK
jgi:hypothetical protein